MLSATIIKYPQGVKKFASPSPGNGGKGKITPRYTFGQSTMWAISIYQPFIPPGLKIQRQGMGYKYIQA